MPQLNSYSQVLDYLYSQLPMYQRQGAAAYKADLSNTIALCNALGNPERAFKSVHIAGTNGKGTTSHTIASILQEAGYKTGLYTSPHLKDFRERIRINGQMVEKEFVVDFVNKIQATISEIQPSFFEITVAMAFQYFADQEVDIAVIETGMGGRLDSTNVVSPLASVITSIGLDHQKFLGDTLELIAAEKAEIIKKDTPVVLAHFPNEGVRSVFIEKAKSVNASVNEFGQQYTYVDTGEGFNILHPARATLRINSFPILGEYYKLNLPLALEIIQELNIQGFEVSNEAKAHGISNLVTNTGLKGRWQILQTSPLVITDMGHNEDGVKHIVQQLNNTAHKRLHLVWGSVNDKDQQVIFDLLPKSALYYFCQPKIPRALGVEQLREIGDARKLSYQIIPDVKEALNEAKQNADSEDLIFVGGSTFVVAELDL